MFKFLLGIYVLKFNERVILSYFLKFVKNLNLILGSVQNLMTGDTSSTIKGDNVPEMWKSPVGHIICRI